VQGKKQSQTIEAIIRHYLETGDDVSRAELAYKPPFPRPTKQELQAALSVEVRKREREHPRAILPPNVDPLSLARTKAEPMVRGLFPAVEREPVQRALERSVIFLTADNIHEVITSARWLKTAWRVANIYLDSIGAEPLGSGVQPVGLGEETTSYISLKYFSEDDSFADYVVHEMAHVFHNWKRVWTGLREIRHREFLLNIDFAKRETFAFACEVYSRILCLGQSPSERRQLLEQFGRKSQIAGTGEERVELLQILEAAVEARNGWKRILERCSDGRAKRLRGGISSAKAIDCVTVRAMR
jgi:hypothetical protein